MKQIFYKILTLLRVSLYGKEKPRLPINLVWEYCESIVRIPIRRTLTICHFVPIFYRSGRKSMLEQEVITKNTIENNILMD